MHYELLSWIMNYALCIMNCYRVIIKEHDNTITPRRGGVCDVEAHSRGKKKQLPFGGIAFYVLNRFNLRIE